QKALGVINKQASGRWLNNRAENSHQPFRRREQAMLRFRRMRTEGPRSEFLQKFAAVHGSIHNRSNRERALISLQSYKDRRTAALAQWRQLGAA
ncbi:MAG: transposase, partial [Hyphomonas sp.]|nr:transposase [Hyphomonas sp.]